jgi:hypothetical protein
MQLTIDEMRITSARRLRLSSPALLTFCIAATLHAQSFSSGSTGADGDLIVNASGVTTFTATPVGGGNIYNFKTIQIGSGATLRLSGQVFPGPLYFLAQGAVTVAGTIDLSGQNGVVPATSGQRTGPTIPGPGGYGGGAAAFGANAALPGLGPLGGAVNGVTCYGRLLGGPGGTAATQFLVPLAGGSGGGGNVGGNGGAGGGALLIASSVSITVNGTITAAGGSGTSTNGGNGSGGGAGGGIRLVAPIIAGAGTGTITAAGGNPGYNNGCNNAGANGIVRLESFQYTFNGTTGGNLYTASPVALYLPVANTQPLITVTSIGGIAVPSSPSGTFTVPDVLLNSTSPLTVNIHATNVPPGTIPTLYFSTQNFPDQTIVPAALGGTLASSTTTATVTLNPGYSIGFVTASWVQ